MDDVFYAYVVKSIGHDYFYKGHCRDLEKRLEQHNSGMTVSLRPYIPVEVVYFEAFQSREEAIKRERYFKTSRGSEFLRGKLSYKG